MAFGFDDAMLVSMGLNQLNSMAHNSKQIEKEASPEWMINAAYNTPANQVARLREAGLNPNLAYGTVNTGNISGTGSRTGAGHYQKSFGDGLDLLNSLVSLASAIGGEKRANEEMNLKKRQQTMDALELSSRLAYQQDALELEKKRFAIELGLKDRDYNLRRDEFNWKKSTHREPQKSATTLASEIIGNVIGKPVTDVATDTHNLLKGLVGFGLKWSPIMNYLPLFYTTRGMTSVKSKRGSYLNW